MKKSAFILFLIFFLVQAVPVIHSIFSEETTVFLVDEEKSTEKSDIGKFKDTKECDQYIDHSLIISQKITTAFHLVEKILHSPCLEELTPPPDFS